MKSPLRSRERILLYGVEGAGKTTAALQMGSENDGKTWVISTDNSIERLLETDFAGTFTDETLELYDVETWPEYRDALTEIWEKVDKDDLIIIDNITWPWDTIKTWYVEEVYGVDMTDWINQYRSKLTSAAGHSAQEAIFEDWGFINPNWYGLHSQKLVKPKCHLICTANAKQMRTDGKVSKELKDLYATLKMSPDTQKRVGAQMQTVLYLFQDSLGYHYATAKDRGRVNETKADWENFVDDYLVSIAGWMKEQPVKKLGLKKKEG